MSDQFNNIDDLFSQRLGDMDFTPTGKPWEGISRNLAENELDRAFKKGLVGYEVAPSARVWASLSQRLPLSPYLHRALTWASAVAGVLILGLFATSVASEFSGEQQPASQQTISPIAGDATSLEVVSGGNYSKYNDMTLEALQSGWDAEMSSLFNARKGNTSARSKAAMEAERQERQLQLINTLVACGIQPNDASAAALQLSEAAEVLWRVHEEERQQENASMEAQKLNNIKPVAISIKNAKTGEVIMFPVLDINAERENHPVTPPTHKHNVKSLNPWSLVANAGPSMSFIQNGDFVQQNKLAYLNTYGYNAGLYANYALNQKMSVQVGAQYANLNQGFLVEKGEHTGDQLSANAQYVYIPVSFKHQFLALGKNEKYKLSYSAGAQYGRLIGSESPAGLPLVSNELGLLAGMEVSTKIAPNLNVSLGPRLSSGSDVSKLGQLFSDKNTLNILASFNIGFIYQVERKKP